MVSLGELPKVRWQDSGKEVPKEVVTWLIVQNFKFKSPEAGPLLRRYCAMLRPADRGRAGQFVLGAVARSGPEAKVYGS